MRKPNTAIRATNEKLFGMFVQPMAMTCELDAGDCLECSMLRSVSSEAWTAPTPPKIFKRRPASSLCEKKAKSKQIVNDPKLVNRHVETSSRPHLDEWAQNFVEIHHEFYPRVDD
jgi:hypothetical protein